MNTTIQVRIDAKTKSEAQKILKKVGIDLSSAIKMFLSQVVSKKTIPLEFRDEAGFTHKKKKELLKDLEWAKKHGKRFTDIDELFRELNA